MANGKKKYRRYLAQGPLDVKTGQKHVLDVGRSIVITSPAHDGKHYINLPEDGDHPDQGEYADVEAQVTPARGGVQVFWRIVSEQSSFPQDRAVHATLAGAALNGSMKAGLGARGSQSRITSTNGRGIARVKLYLPKYGGDRVKVTAGLRLDHDGSSRELTVWRKLWYQIVHGDHVDVPLPDATRTAYQGTFVELVERKRTQFTEEDTKGITCYAGPVTTYYPRWMVDPAGNDDRVVVVGSQNEDKLYDKYKHNATDRVFVVGDYGCSALAANFTGTTELAIFPDVTFDAESTLSDELELSECVISPHPAEPSLVVTGTWKVDYAEARDPGRVEAEHVVFAPEGRFQITWPAEREVPGAWQTLQVKFKLTSRGGSFEPIMVPIRTVTIDPVTRRSEVIALDKAVTEGGDVIVTGAFQVYTPKCTRSGPLVDGDLVFDEDRGPVAAKRRARLKYVRVRWPAREKLPGEGDVAEVTLQLNAVRGDFAGVRYKNRVTVVGNEATAGTFTHEIGHTVNQVLKDDNPPGGLPPHPFKYTGCGGQGPHCHMVLRVGAPVAGTLVWWAAGNMNVYARGDCVMHGGGGEDRANDFCDVCKIYVRAQDMTLG